MRQALAEAKRRIDVFLTPNRLLFIIAAGLFAFHACTAPRQGECRIDWDGFSNPQICR